MLFLLFFHPPPPCPTTLINLTGLSLAATALRILRAVLSLARALVPVRAAGPKKTAAAAPAKRGTGGRLRTRPPPARPAATPAASATPAPGASLTTLNRPAARLAAASPLDLASLRGHTASGGVTALAWSGPGGGGTRLATAGADRAVRLVADPANAGSLNPPVRRDVGAAAVGVAFVRPGGGASGEPSTVVAVLTRGGPLDAPALSALGPGRDPLWALPAPGENAAFLGGHRALGVRAGAGVLAVASEKNQLEVYALRDGCSPPTRLAALDTAGIRTHDLAVSADGAWVAAATFAPDVTLWAVIKAGRTGAPAAVVRGPLLSGHAGQVLAVALSADGRAAATSCRDGSVAVWSLPRWTRHDGEGAAGPPARLRFRAPAPLAVGSVYRRLALSPDGRVCAAATDGGDLHFLDAGTGALLSAVEPAHGGPVTALEWDDRGGGAPGGGHAAVLASAGEDGAVHLWASPLDVPA